MDFDLENPLTSSIEIQSDSITGLFDSESDYMPSRSFLQCLEASAFYHSFRQDAISTLFHARSSRNYDHFVLYLAINYMDRFISRQEIPQEKPWVPQLLVIACLSLAAKMKNKHFLISDFQKEEGFIFDAQTISRMELVILDALNWRMRSITPFSFMSFFISLFEIKDPPLTQILKDRAAEIVFVANNEMKLLEFKPSIIVASALLVASHELFPLQFPSFKCSIFSYEHVNKDKLLQCFNAVQEMVGLEWYQDITSSSISPLSVLDRHCRKSKSETTNTTTFSSAELPQERAIKRRRIDGYN
ncbi:hypothetical protein K2173_004451 [Erythroxylum novogranatense]|uniref:B-like cyclin n=1 Tax=Erythroxylum novogranatense TaxID=1862640 RepID=A0AAV8T5Z1_9ROSI|nr:hypothetical protein K2173_004451 [Erythroxylum novogranatense]